MKSIWTSIMLAISKVYLRFTDPRRKIASIKRKLEANREAQKKIISQVSTPALRKRFIKLVNAAVKLRKELARLQG